MASGSVWGLDEFKRYAPRWAARGSEFARRRSFYDGSRYGSIMSGLGWLGPRLGGGIRALYLPCARAVNLDAGIVPGGWALERGNEAAVDQIFEWSDWTIQGVLFAHYGSLYGSVVLRVSDRRQEKRISLAPMNPETVLLVGSVYGDAPRLAITVQAIEMGGRVVEYAEVVEPERVRTFIDGQRAGVDGRPAEYRNELGFVPFVEAQHIAEGGDIGACAFQDAMTLLDAVNEVGTDLATIVKKHARPKWAVLGADESDLSNEDDIWTFPAGSDVKVLVPGIDVVGVLKFLQDIRVQVERAIPELAFDEIVSKYNLATATVELQLAELVLKIRRVRPNYDRALERALRMAELAARSMGLGLTVGPVRFDAGRPVLPQDERARLELELLRAQVDAAQRVAVAPVQPAQPAQNGVAA